MTKTRTIQIISTKEESLTSSFVHPVEHPKYIFLAKLVKHAKCIFFKIESVKNEIKNTKIFHNFA